MELKDKDLEKGLRTVAIGNRLFYQQHFLRHYDIILSTSSVKAVEVYPARKIARRLTKTQTHQKSLAGRQ